MYLGSSSLSLSHGRTHKLTHKHKHALCDAAPQAGRPLHLPHLLCPQLNFDQSFQRQRRVCELCMHRARVFAYEHLRNQSTVAYPSAGACYNCIFPPAVDKCLDSVCVCVWVARHKCQLWFGVEFAEMLDEQQVIVWQRKAPRELRPEMSVLEECVCVCFMLFQIPLPVMLPSICSLCGSLIRQWAGLRPCLKRGSPGLLGEHLLKDHSTGCVWGGLLSSDWSLPQFPHASATLVSSAPPLCLPVFNTLNPLLTATRTLIFFFSSRSVHLLPIIHLHA